MRGKSETAETTSPVLEADAVLQDEVVSMDLQARGVDASAAELLAGAITSRLNERPDASREVYDAMLDGAASACHAQLDVCESLSKSARELQEIERLMGSFAGELSKLDEVLEVLAAYLRRMRTATPEPDRIIH